MQLFHIRVLFFGVLVMLFGCTYSEQLPVIAARTLPQSPITFQSPLPRIVAELPLAAANATLLDLRYDPHAQRLYVTDTAGYLYVIDADRYIVLATLRAMGGELTLDPTHQLLYAAPGDDYFPEAGQNVITVIDTSNHTIIGLLPGRHVAVDEVQNRLFIGEAILTQSVRSGTASLAGVRMYDGASLTPIRELPQAGVPFYNPLRNELLIMAHTVYVVDPENPTTVMDLFPELAAQSAPWCNGCTWADALHLFPEANLIAIYIRPHCMGGGCNFTRPPHFFDATTLEGLPDLADLPELQGDCGSERLLLTPIMGQTYRTYAFHRYVSLTNLMIYDAYGDTIGWRDGIQTRFVNPQTAQAYLAGGIVLDLATLNPVGQWPESCVFTYNEDKGLLYARGPAGVLRVIDQQGAAPLQETPLPTSPVGHAISTILLSPDYANDQTLLLVVGHGMLLRSTDGGQQWQWLRGGLPAGEPLNLQVAFSPNYAVDRTIFAAGYRHEGRGEGVLRSTDRGNSWQRQWQGLTHLRINELRLSPFFTSDQTLWVKANYHHVPTGEIGQSWQRSTDKGLTWSLVATGTSELELSQALTDVINFPARTTFTLPVQIREGDHGLAYSPNRGASWLPIALPLAEGEWMLTLLPAPTYAIDGAADGVIYALSDYHLWRTSDNGQSWSRWLEPLAQQRVYRNALRVLEISPLLANGRYQLFVGTNDGHFSAFYPDEQNWQLIPLH